MPKLFPKDDYPVARDSNKARRAEQVLESHVRTGADRQQRIVELVGNMHITDALAAPSEMTYEHNKKLEVTIKGTTLGIHPHALQQMANVFEYPVRYLGKLQSGMSGIPPSVCRAKLVNDLNWHASHVRLKNRKQQPAKFLVRFVDNEIRGFLTQSYKRHLASKPLMRAFVHACDQAGMKPIDGHASPVRVNLQCALPYLFEPYEGEFIAVGVAWTNSDFGGGRMKVSMFMKRVHGTSSIVLNDAISEVHIGPVIEEADIELSRETHNAELEAQKRAVADSVKSQITPDHVEGVLEAIRVAQAEKIPWERLNHELAKLMQKKEREHIHELLTGAKAEGFEELPPIEFDDDDDPIPTRWWASTVIGQFAEKEPNAERKKELQEFAGQVLGKAAQKKKKKQP